MSALPIVALSLATAYLVHKQMRVQGTIDNLTNEWNSAAKPDDSGNATSAEIRDAWKNIDSTKYSDMAEYLTKPQRNELEAGQLAAVREVRSYDDGPASLTIVGVPLEFGV